MNGSNAGGAGQYDRWFLGECDISTARRLLINKPPGTFFLHVLPSSSVPSPHPTFELSSSFHSPLSSSSPSLSPTPSPQQKSFICSFVTKESKYAAVELKKIDHGYVFAPYSEDNTKQCLERRPVFSDVQSFIRSNSHLRYNLSHTNIPDIEVEAYIPNDPNTELIDFVAPINNQPTIIEKKSVIYGHTIATYPRETVGSKTLCDALRARICGNRAILVLADGCGWGSRAQTAAEIAAKAAIEYLSKDSVLESITAERIPAELFNAMDFAHNCIIEQQGTLSPSGTIDTVTCGTTTLITGMVMKIKPTLLANEWAFVCASVGDCKAYHLNGKTGKITDITFGNRNVRDPKDCGGRLGPWVNDKDPDLRNRNTYYWPCVEGDFVFIVSDGIHDNLDPEHLGKAPDLIFKGKYNYKTWEEMPVELVEKLKSRYARSLLEDLLNGCNTPKKIGRVLVKYAENVTKRTREYMEANPAAKEPDDYKEYPGKMDHSSCLCISIKDRNTWINPPKKDKKKNFFTKPKKNSIDRRELIGSTGGNGGGGGGKEALKIFLCPFPEKTEVSRFELKKTDLYSKVTCSSDVAGWPFTTFPLSSKEDAINKKSHLDQSGFSLEVSAYRHTCILTSVTNCLPSAAVISANRTFMTDISKAQTQMSDSSQVTTKLTTCLELAVLAAHKNLTDTTDSEVNIVCGMAARLPNLQNLSRTNWIFLCANYGHNKAFHWSHTSKKLKDITSLGETETKPLKNSTHKAEPFDITTLKFYSQHCDDEEKDIIILMTPLVYLNHDPEVMGFSANQIFSDSKNKKEKEMTWSKVTPEQRDKIRLKTLEKVLQRAPKEDADTFVEVLIQSTLETTGERREFLKANVDQEKGIEDVPYTKLRGKMGDGLCAAFRVGQLVLPENKHISNKSRSTSKRGNSTGTMKVPKKPSTDQSSEISLTTSTKAILVDDSGLELDAAPPTALTLSRFVSATTMTTTTTKTHSPQISDMISPRNRNDKKET